MLSEKEFTKRYVKRLMEVFQEPKGVQWMKDIAPDAYEMWVDDSPETTTPEDMADSECDEMRRDC
jgi:hypothetical protein